MSSKEELHKILVTAGLELAGPLVFHHEDGGGYIAFVRVSINQKGQKSPGSRALSQIARQAEESGYRISLIAVSDEGNDLDASLKTILFAKFGDKVRNAFSSLVNQRFEVWIEPKAQLTQQDKERIRNAVAEFSELIGFSLLGVNFTDTENTPTPTAILKVLRIKSPCTLERLSEALKEHGFTVPNAVWLSHALDKLRKTGLVVRSKDGDFLLSLSALTRLGTAKGRKSPDILRALDFARRRV